MDKSSILPFLDNAVWLLTIVILYSLAPHFAERLSARVQDLITGVILGCIGLLIMLTPWEYQPGIVFDARSVLLAVSGLFFGVVPTLIAIAMTAAYRLIQGGQGVIVGVAVIAASGMIGLLWRHFRLPHLKNLTSYELLTVGFTVHVAMLALMLLLPWETAIKVLTNIALPVLIIYPATFTAVGLILVSIFRQQAVSRDVEQNEFLFHAQFSKGNIGMAITSPEKGWLRVNEHLCQMLGYTKEELKTRTWSELTHPDDLTADLSQFNAMLSGKIDYYELEKRFIRKNGETVYTHLTAACHRSGSEIDFVIASMLDIGETRKAQELLTKKAFFLEKGQSLGHLGSWEVDPETGVLSCSDEIFRIFELPESESVSYNVFMEKIHPDDLAQVDKELRATYKGKPFRLDHRLLIHGKIKWIRQEAVLEFSGRHPHATGFGFVQDITEQKQTEIALRNSLDDLERSQRTAKLGSWHLDVKTNQVTWSEELYRMYGFDSSVPPPPYTEHNSIFTPESWNTLNTALALTASSGVPYELELETVRVDGSNGWMWVHGEAIYDNHGEIIGLRGVAQDITQMKTTELERLALFQQLEAKNRELEQFSYAVSHDLKSPLVTIQGFTNMLRIDALEGNDKRVSEDVEHINTAINTMESLLNELLEFSRIGRLRNESERISMATLAENVIQLLTGRHPMARKVEFVMSPDLPDIYGDKPRIRQVLQNLFDNSLKFLGDQPEPRIELGFSISPGEVIFRVRDNGIGIESRYHETVFDMFEHLDPEIEGSGIGLALVKRIITVHDGRVWLESDGPGTGTTVFFSVPNKKE